jgi:hypothetical protein
MAATPDIPIADVLKLPVVGSYDDGVKVRVEIDALIAATVANQTSVGGKWREDQSFYIDLHQHDSLFASTDIPAYVDDNGSAANVARALMVASLRHVTFGALFKYPLVRVFAAGGQLDPVNYDTELELALHADGSHVSGSWHFHNRYAPEMDQSLAPIPFNDMDTFLRTLAVVPINRVPSVEVHARLADPKAWPTALAARAAFLRHNVSFYIPPYDPFQYMHPTLSQNYSAVQFAAACEVSTGKNVSHELAHVNATIRSRIGAPMDPRHKSTPPFMRTTTVAARRTHIGANLLPRPEATAAAPASHTAAFCAADLLADVGPSAIADPTKVGGNADLIKLYVRGTTAKDSMATEIANALGSAPPATVLTESEVLHAGKALLQSAAFDTDKDTKRLGEDAAKQLIRLAGASLTDAKREEFYRFVVDATAACTTKDGHAIKVAQAFVAALPRSAPAATEPAQAAAAATEPPPASSVGGAPAKLDAQSAAALLLFGKRIAAYTIHAFASNPSANAAEASQRSKLRTSYITREQRDAKVASLRAQADLPAETEKFLLKFEMYLNASSFESPTNPAAYASFVNYLKLVFIVLTEIVIDTGNKGKTSSTKRAERLKFLTADINALGTTSEGKIGEMLTAMADRDSNLMLALFKATLDIKDHTSLIGARLRARVGRRFFGTTMTDKENDSPRARSAFETPLFSLARGHHVS